MILKGKFTNPTISKPKIVFWFMDNDKTNMLSWHWQLASLAIERSTKFFRNFDPKKELPISGSVDFVLIFGSVFSSCVFFLEPFKTNCGNPTSYLGVLL